MRFRPFPVIDMLATGKNIARLREKSGLSVSDLQEYFGFDAPQAIYKWQRGQTLPSTDNLLALGQLLEVPIEDILVTREAENETKPQDETCGDHYLGDCSLLKCFVSMAFNYGFNDRKLSFF